MNKAINQDEIKEWLHRFNTGGAFYTVDLKIIFDPYIYNETVFDFVKYAYKQGWVDTDYQRISDTWKQAANKIIFIKQLNQEDVFRMLAWHIRGDRFCGGLLGCAFDAGHIQTALKRLLEIETGI